MIFIHRLMVRVIIVAAAIAYTSASFCGKPKGAPKKEAPPAVLKGLPLDPVQRRMFWLEDLDSEKTPPRKTYANNVEQVRYIAGNLPIYQELLGYSAYLAKKEPVEALFGPYAGSSHAELCRVAQDSVLSVMTASDTDGTTMAHKWAYFFDVDRPLYGQLTPEQKEALSPQNLTLQLAILRMLGMDFRAINHAGQTPLHMVDRNSVIANRLKFVLSQTTEQLEKLLKDAHEAEMKKLREQQGQPDEE